jgi:YgiT-type zinc finger domain-containing protein
MDALGETFKRGIIFRDEHWLTTQEYAAWTSIPFVSECGLGIILSKAIMANKPTPTCGEHHISKEWRPATFEYSEGGISVRVPNVYAWVCPSNGEASFTPETMDELVITARELLETARRARQRRSVLTEYVVSVGEPVTASRPT